jgi:anti-sigma factor ChrR (cupin superfamily)
MYRFSKRTGLTWPIPRRAYPKRRKAAMKEVTVRAATHLAPSGSRYVDVAAMPWQEPFAGIRTKVLYKDNEAKETTMLVETQPGTLIPEHIHGEVEWAFILEGTI